MANQSGEEVAFDVLLRAPGAGSVPDVATIDQCRPDAEAVERCRRWFAARGVTTHATQFGLAGSTPRALFESLFGVRLKPVRPAVSGRPAFETIGKLQLPTEIADAIEQVTLSAPPEFF